MNQNIQEGIGWIEGQWGPTNKLSIPIADRGLNLGDGIFETILIYKGEVKLITKHLERWQRNASMMHMASPPTQEWLTPLINEAIQRASLRKKNGRLRINWSRGSNSSRGINIPNDQPLASDHRFWLEITPDEPRFNSLSTTVHSEEKRNANTQLSYCKTFAYSQSIKARHDAKLAGFDDALLLSTSGEICCSTTANLLIKRKKEWITPRLQSGCLPGIMRERAIESGLAKEAKINSKPFKEDQWLLINSLSCQPIKRINNQCLSVFKNSKELWLSLLEE